MTTREIKNRLPISESEPSGMDCFGDDREGMNDFAKYYNNTHLSDINIIVGDDTYPAHKLILAKSSDVFDRMLSDRWNGDKKDLEIVEDVACETVFNAFLRFLYCNHVVLHQENCLPLLILADKYNIVNLKTVCIKYAMNEILPQLPLRELFDVWFSYASKAFHTNLIRACILSIAKEFETLLTEEWDKSWLNLHRDQLMEILRSNQIVVTNEYKIWEGVNRWLQAPNHPERRGPTASPFMAQLLPLIRFAFMTADELSQVERSPVAENYPKLFHPIILLAYKWQALPLSSRASQKEFSSNHFVLRKYTDTRWDKLLSVSIQQLYVNGIDHAFIFSTRSCTFPLQTWKWTVKICGSSYNPQDNAFQAFLVAEDIDSPRSVEYMISLVDEKKVLKSCVGKKNFTKTRYSAEIDFDKRVEIGDLLAEDSSYVVDGKLHLQLVIKPIE
ncbi:unnamed protein product [Auanema sp. JU1783]|nr:unnamed protein product [Auanema sp. JU1783]